MLATFLWLEYCQAWFSELSFSRISESTTAVVQGIYLHPVWDLLPPINTSEKGPSTFSVSYEKCRQCEVNKIA